MANGAAGESRNGGRRAVFADAGERSSPVVNSLEQAMARGEAFLARLEDEVADAEERLAEATAMAERTVRVAAELRQDVSSLILALQQAAQQVDAQMKEHAAALLTALSASSPAISSGGLLDWSESLDREAQAHLDEIRAVAGGITEDLDRRAAELRQLVSGVSAPRLDSGSREKPAPVEDRSRRTARSFSAEPGPLLGLSDKARVVEDEVALGSGSTTETRPYAQAVALAAQGLSADDIARRCGLGREEVRMLLRLRR